MPEEVHAVFVYGTLMPGHLRWPVLAPHVIGWRKTTVPGRLYDTGRGWPSAVLDDPTAVGTVPGVVVGLYPGSAPALLAALDELEGVPHLFRRVVVRSADGTAAWAWSGAEPSGGFKRIERWAPEHEA